MKIALIGRTKFLLNTGKYLHKKGIKIELVITSKNAEHDNVTSKDFEKFARITNAKFLCIENINSEQIKIILKKMKLDLGVSVNNPLLIKKEIIKQFKFGIINAHAGDLPRYRGNACPNWAIINNEKNIGITIHFMTEKLDAGDIIVKKRFKIKEKTKILDFYTYAETEIPKMFFESINKIKTKKTNFKKQNEKNILRTFPRNKSDGKIDWDMNAKHIDRLIRASGEPFFGAYTYFESFKLIINKAEVKKIEFEFCAEPGQIIERNKKDGSVSVACKDGFIAIQEIIYKNKLYSKPNQVIKTIHTRLGMDIESEIERINLRLDKIEKEKNH